MPLWELPNARVLAPLHDVVVRAEHIHGDQPRYVTMDVFDFADWMISTGRYPREAVPHDALVSAALDFYICRVETGGHYHFAGDSAWDEALRDDIEEGIDRLGFDALAELFAELEAFSYEDPERFETANWTDPTFRSLDERFNRLPRQEYFERHADWIRSWPNLLVVPGAGYREVMAELFERNGVKPPW